MRWPALLNGATMYGLIDWEKDDVIPRPKHLFLHMPLGSQFAG